MSRRVPILTLVPRAGNNMWFLSTTVAALTSTCSEDVLLIARCQDRLTALWQDDFAAGCCTELTVTLSELIALRIMQLFIAQTNGVLHWQKRSPVARSILQVGTICFFWGALPQLCLWAAKKCLLLKNSWRGQRGRNYLLGLWFSFIWKMLVSPFLASHSCCISLCRFQNSPSLM